MIVIPGYQSFSLSTGYQNFVKPSYMYLAWWMNIVKGLHKNHFLIVPKKVRLRDNHLHQGGGAHGAVPL